MGMPKLKKCVLMGGLKNVKSVRMENAGKFESVKRLKEVMEEERKRREEEERKKREEEERKRKEEERKRREEAERKRREEEERKRREEEERKKREEAERKRREMEERKRREEAERKKREEMIALAKATVNVRNVGELKNAIVSVRTVVVASNCCNESELSMLDLSRFVNLRELKVGDKCFKYVDEVKLIGLKELESVVIGKNSFTKNNNYWFGKGPNRHFYLKNCERVRELKMGRYSFYDYSVCEIENVPSLEVIEMGGLNEKSYGFYNVSLIERSGNFFYASKLELKSDSERMQ